MSYDHINFNRSVPSVCVHSLFGTIYSIIAFSLLGLVKLIFKFIRLGRSKFFYRLSRPKPPENALNPVYGTHHMIKLKSSGVSLHYVSNGYPNQPMILFIHGFPECWFSWRHQMKHFSKEFRVVAVDIRGYGLSSKPSNTNDYRIETLVKDIADLIEQLGYEACDIVAHGTGGTIAWFTAMLYPHLVERLVIINSPHPAALYYDLTVKQLKHMWPIYFSQIPWIPEYEFDADDYSKINEVLREKPYGLVHRDHLSDDDLEVYKYTFSQEGLSFYETDLNIIQGQLYIHVQGTTKAAINYFRTQILYPDKDCINVVIAPVLLIWGCQNPMYDEKLADLSQQYHEDLVIRKIPWASHWANQDAPDAVNIYIDMFFKERDHVLSHADSEI